MNPLIVLLLIAYSGFAAILIYAMCAVESQPERVA